MLAMLASASPGRSTGAALAWFLPNALISCSASSSMALRFSFVSSTRVVAARFGRAYLGTASCWDRGWSGRGGRDGWGDWESYSSPSLHFTSLHFTSLHFTSLHFTTLHFASLRFTSLHFTSLRFASLRFASLHSPPLYFTPLHSPRCLRCGSRRLFWRTVD